MLPPQDVVIAMYVLQGLGRVNWCVLPQFLLQLLSCTLECWVVSEVWWAPLTSVNQYIRCLLPVFDVFIEHSMGAIRPGSSRWTLAHSDGGPVELFDLKHYVNSRHSRDKAAMLQQRLQKLVVLIC